MQVFVVGAPRSGTTIITQALNTHEEIKIFDEVSLIDVLEFGGSIVGKLRAFLMERGVYEDFRDHARKTDDPPAALRHVMTAITAPRSIWGEKNPMYATRLDALRRGFPEAVILFILRDPRAVVHSYLVHRGSPSRSPMDFWIKDSVSDALALVESCVNTLHKTQTGLTVLRYEDFIAGPKATLDELFTPWNIRFPQGAMVTAHAAPDTVGDQQFFRRGAPLPWKLGNLSPIRPDVRSKDRLDESDPAWSRVETLATSLGYPPS
jgi:hypothetical protein